LRFDLSRTEPADRGRPRLGARGISGKTSRPKGLFDHAGGALRFYRLAHEAISPRPASFALRVLAAFFALSAARTCFGDDECLYRGERGEACTAEPSRIRAQIAGRRIRDGAGPGDLRSQSEFSARPPRGSRKGSGASRGISHGRNSTPLEIDE